VLQSSVVHVEIQRQASQTGGRKLEYIEVRDQRQRLTEAFCKLLACRAIEGVKPSGDSTGGKEKEEHGRGEKETTKKRGRPDKGAGEEEEEEEEEEGEMSEYEKIRLARMRENQRIMMATGIIGDVEAAKNSAKESSKHGSAGEAGAARKKKEKREREELEGFEEQPRRTLRSRVSDASEMLDDEGAEEMGDAGSANPNAEVAEEVETEGGEVGVKAPSNSREVKGEKPLPAPTEEYPEGSLALNPKPSALNPDSQP